MLTRVKTIHAWKIVELIKTIIYLENFSVVYLQKCDFFYNDWKTQWFMLETYFDMQKTRLKAKNLSSIALTEEKN